jgi:hypothetical protein
MSIETTESQKTLSQIAEECHSLVHEISFNIGNNDLPKAKELLLSLDILLHDCI